MKPTPYGAMDSEKPGLVDAEGKYRDLSGICDDIGSAAFAGGLPDRLKGIEPASLPQVDPDVRLGAYVGGVGKFLCIGLNYRDHAEESGMAIPTEPILFMKATSAICGPNDDVVIPKFRPSSLPASWSRYGRDAWPSLLPSARCFRRGYRRRFPCGH